MECLEAHVEELEAYIAQLEAQAKFSEDRNEALQRRNAELEAMIGLDGVGWNQRRLLGRAVETAENAIKHKDGSNERRQLQGDAGAYILELVRSAKRDDLDVDRFELTYKPKLEQQLTKGEERSAPVGVETQLQ
jgi:hypothetical protein